MRYLFLECFSIFQVCHKMRNTLSPWLGQLIQLDMTCIDLMLNLSVSALVFQLLYWEVLTGASWMSCSNGAVI